MSEREWFDTTLRAVPDAALPADRGCCGEQHDTGFCCTRHEGHTGRHKAAGVLRFEDGCRVSNVYAVWGGE